jgi:hypothetical protein
MAFALIATAAANLNNIDVCRAAADWLVSHNQPGWGLGFEWDAFGDQSVNPANTVYGITVAVAAQGLLAAHRRCNHASYLQAAVSALDYYSRFFIETPNGGQFWYSDQGSDAIATANISAMLIAPFAEAGELAGRPDFVALADKVAKDLMSRRLSIGDLEYWKYSTRNNAINDAVHSAMIVLGLLEYRRLRGLDLQLNPSIAYLSTFISDLKVLEFSPATPIPEGLEDRPARLWAIGALAAAMEEAGDHTRAKLTLDQMKSYQVSRGKYSNTPNSSKQDVRMLSFVLFGLSKVAQSSPLTRILNRLESH